MSETEPESKWQECEKCGWFHAPGLCGETQPLLNRIAAELAKRAKWRLDQKEDPHGIANAVAVALFEVANSIHQELDK